MFGRKAKRIRELERQLEETQVNRNSFEFQLLRARMGLDEETNAFFRNHPAYAQPESEAGAGTGTSVAAKTSKKTK